MREGFLARLRSPERGRAMFQGIAGEEAIMLPILAEVEQYGDPVEVHFMLHELLTTYLYYRAVDRIRDVLRRIDDLHFIPDGGCWPSIPQRLYKHDILPELIEPYIRKAEIYVLALPESRGRREDLYSLRSLELAYYARYDPHNERIGFLLKEIDQLRKGLRQYNKYLLAALETLISMGVSDELLPDILSGLKGSIRYCIRTWAQPEQARRDAQTVENLLRQLSR